MYAIFTNTLFISSAAKFFSKQNTIGKDERVCGLCYDSLKYTSKSPKKSPIVKHKDMKRHFDENHGLRASKCGSLFVCTNLEDVVPTADRVQIIGTNRKAFKIKRTPPLSEGAGSTNKRGKTTGMTSTGKTSSSKGGWTPHFFSQGD